MSGPTILGSGLFPAFYHVVAWMVHAVWPVTLVAGMFAALLISWRRGDFGFRARIERKRFMTSAEVRFWAVLQAALPEAQIFGQVSMGALLKPVAGLSRNDWWSTYGRFSQKIVDFVVVDPRSGEVLAVVELDDHSHNGRNDAARDALLARGGYPVVRFGSREARDAPSVRARFAGLLDLDRPPTAWRPRAVS